MDFDSKTLRNLYYLYIAGSVGLGVAGGQILAKKNYESTFNYMIIGGSIGFISGIFAPITIPLYSSICIDKFILNELNFNQTQKVNKNFGVKFDTKKLYNISHILK